MNREQSTARTININIIILTGPGMGHHSKPLLDHEGLSKMIQENGTPELKADSRIQSFLQFGDFQPRPEAVPLLPDTKPVNLKTFLELHQDECGDNNKGGLEFCREIGVATVIVAARQKLMRVF